MARKTLLLTLLCVSALAASKPKLTLDEFFNSVSFSSIAISPDGASVVINTERADWDQKIFRKDLWLYRDENKTLIQLTQSGHDTDPKWSPDGRWIAFLSERKAEKGDDNDEKGDISQIYIISPAGGEAVQITQGLDDVHSFSWSVDSRTIYFATRDPWTRQQKDDYREQWKDVVEYRTAERGDAIFSLDISNKLSNNFAAEMARSAKEKSTDLESGVTSGARRVATMPLRVDDLITSPDGTKLAILSNSPNQREERPEDVEIYLVNVERALPAPGSLQALPAGSGSESQSPETTARPRRITHNQALESHLRWAGDNRHIFFTVELGDVSNRYRDIQPHLYWIDTQQPDKPESVQWGKDFIGATENYAVTNSAILASGRLGTEVAMYSASQPTQPFHKLSSWPGSYASISSAARSSRIAFLYSSLQKPEEVYLADSPGKLDQARPITSFNQTLAASDLPQGKTYRWTADDGATVEGLLIYPPGKFEEKHLPMFTLIPGGPDTEGNHFEADWYQWASLAATYGWLVFEPEYRGCEGYGDEFTLQIAPQLFSRPGKDILAGVDALLKDGIADPDHLTVGGYSYGGYLTNWLITQTTRFKAAVTGAGGVENVAGWGNDDTTADDAYFIGGRPWEVPQRYNDEAAIFQIDKVRTPTHMVSGDEDVRVPVLESYLLEHALYSLGVPNKLLILPGEGHSLGKNPWHGKIKVREELNWLQKYGGVPANN